MDEFDFLKNVDKSRFLQNVNTECFTSSLQPGVVWRPFSNATNIKCSTCANKADNYCNELKTYSCKNCQFKQK